MTRRIFPFLLLATVCLAPRLSAFQEAKPGYLGVDLRDLTAAEMKASGVASGCLLNGVVAGSPAAKAGLQKGDIVVEFGGQKVDGAGAFSALIQKTPIGKESPITVVRNGKRENLKVAPAERPAAKAQPSTRWGGQMKMNGMDIDEFLKRIPRVNVNPASKGAAVVVLPEDPDAAEALAKAQALEENGQWSEAAEVYQSMIEGMPDRVLAIEGVGYTGLKEHCERLVLNGPPERLKAYRANFDATADRHFEQAMAERNGAIVDAIAGDFALTTGGDQYLATAGVMAMEQGRLNEAAAFFQRLLRFHPESRLVPSVVLPRLWQCARMLPDAEACAMVAGIADARGLRGTKVVMNRRETTLGGLIGVSSNPVAENDYRTPMDYYRPSPREPRFGSRKWQTPLPVKEGNGLPVNLGESLAYEDRADVGHAILLKSGAMKDGVLSDLLPATIKTPGKKPWEMAPESHAIKCRPILSQGALYLCYEYLEQKTSNAESRLCRIDRESGRILWTTILCSATRAQASANPYSMNLSGGVIHISTNIGVVAAVDGSSGAILWMAVYPSKTTVGGKSRFIIDNNPTQTPSPREVHERFQIDACPVLVVNGVALILPVDCDAVMAFDSATGKPLWKREVNRSNYPNLEGVVGDKVILTMRGSAAALDVKTGSDLWRRNIAGLAPCGKGALTALALYSPVWEGVCRIDLRDGTSSIVHKWIDPDSEAGSLMISSSGVASVSPGAISFFGSP